MTHRELADKIETLDKQAPDGPIRYDEEGCSLDAHNDAVCMFHSAVEHERAIALVSLRNLAPDIVVALRAQADEIKRLAEGIILCIDASWRPNEARDWGRPELILSEYIGELYDEIHALRAEAIVRGSHKLDEAVKVAQRREAIKAAWKRINDERGWLERARQHDSRCRALFNTQNPHCTCGADAFRKLMEE